MSSLIKTLWNKSELCLNQAYDGATELERNCLIIYVNLIMPVEVEACHKY